jgi:hypothetical protein
MPALRDKAAAHVRSARRFWRHARDVRRWDWPDVASTIEDRARHHLRVARWLADGAPDRPGTLVHRTVRPRTLYLGGGVVMAVADEEPE